MDIPENEKAASLRGCCMGVPSTSSVKESGVTSRPTLCHTLSLSPPIREETVLMPSPEGEHSTNF